MNPDKFRNTNANVDPAKFERAVGKSSVTNFELSQQLGGVPSHCGDAQDGPQYAQSPKQPPLVF